MKLWKYSGTFLTATGIIHTIVALVMGKDMLLGMIKEGVINSLGEGVDRNNAFWFLVCGIIIILLGQTLQYYIKKNKKPAPVFLGYSLLLISIIGCLFAPISGFWLFLPQALIIIFANRKESSKQ